MTQRVHPILPAASLVPQTLNNLAARWQASITALACSYSLHRLKQPKSFFSHHAKPVAGLGSETLLAICACFHDLTHTYEDTVYKVLVVLIYLLSLYKKCNHALIALIIKWPKETG